MTTATPGPSGVSPSDQASTPAPDRVTPLLKGALPPALAVGAAAVVVATVLLGTRGLWGALVGIVIVLLFSGGGLYAMRLVRTQDPMLVMVVALVSYTLRVVLFGVAIALVGSIHGIDGFLDRTATAVTALVCIIGWVTGEIRAYTRLRIPTFDVTLPAAETAEAAETNAASDDDSDDDSSDRSGDDSGERGERR